MENIIIGNNTKLEDLVSVSRYKAKVEFSEIYIERVRRCRQFVEKFAVEKQPIYGITTGLGDNWKKFIPKEDRIKIQKNHILAHACSVGSPMNEESIRAMMFTMLIHFGSGHTGIRLETVELIKDMLNENVIPYVPGQGSVGYLCLEAHIGMVLIGEGKAWYKGELLSGKEALRRAGLKPTVLSSKEGLTIVSGTTSVTAIAALGIYDAITMAKTSDISGAITLEVLKGTLMAMDEKIMKARPHIDQMMTAENINNILKDSKIVERYKDHRVQDALSIRCMPQLHGAVKKTIKDSLDTLYIELNSSVDNPLIFEEEDGSPVALMGCNADGSYLGMESDYITIAVTDLCKMSLSRINRMLNHLVSELPAFLNKNSDYNDGLMMIEYAAVGLLGEMKLNSYPSVVDNAITCANQEDYISMGYNAAKKLYDTMQIAKYIIAIELICGGQALSFYDKEDAGIGTKAAYATLRKVVPEIKSDVPLEPYIEAVAEQVVNREYIDSVEGAIGKLAF